MLGSHSLKRLLSISLLLTLLISLTMHLCGAHCPRNFETPSLTALRRHQKSCPGFEKHQAEAQGIRQQLAAAGRRGPKTRSALGNRQSRVPPLPEVCFRGTCHFIMADILT